MVAFSIFIVWGNPLIISVIWYITGISRNWDGIYFRGRWYCYRRDHTAVTTKKFRSPGVIRNREIGRRTTNKKC